MCDEFIFYDTPQSPTSGGYQLYSVGSINGAAI